MELWGGARHLHSIHTAWTGCAPFVCCPHHPPSCLIHFTTVRSISFGFIQLKHTEAAEACQKFKADTTLVAEYAECCGFVGRYAKGRADPSKELGVQQDFLQNAATSTVALW